jgi:hypothetical protein
LFNRGNGEIIFFLMNHDTTIKTSSLATPTTTTKSDEKTEVKLAV